MDDRGAHYNYMYKQTIWKTNGGKTAIVSTPEIRFNGKFPLLLSLATAPAMMFDRKALALIALDLMALSPSFEGPLF